MLQKKQVTFFDFDLRPVCDTYQKHYHGSPAVRHSIRFVKPIFSTNAFRCTFYSYLCKCQRTQRFRGVFATLQTIYQATPPPPPKQKKNKQKNNNNNTHPKTHQPTNQQTKTPPPPKKKEPQNTLTHTINKRKSNHRKHYYY